MSAQVVGLGARSALGSTPLQIAMAARARRLVPRTLPLFDRRGRRIGACPAVGMDADLSGYERLLALGAGAAWQATVEGGEVLVLMLALPERDRPGDDPRLDNQVLVDLAARAALPLDVERSRVFRSGHAAGAEALEAALALLADPEGPAEVLVGGIDSWLSPDLLAWLDGEERLHALDVDDGFVPAEAAAFALLCRRREVRGRAVRAAVHGARSAREPSALTDEPNLAAAMTGLLHGAVESAPVKWVLTDVNGERYRIREWTQVEIRTLRGEATVQRLPDRLGDLGAATGMLGLALACSCWSAGCAPAGSALVALHSDGAERGIILLEAPA